MHYEIALLRRVRETLREIARDDFLFPKDLEDLGVVRWRSRRLLGDKLRAEVDADRTATCSQRSVAARRCSSTRYAFSPA